MKTSPSKIGKFPKERYKNKPNQDTNFVSKTESATLPASPNWDGYFAIQLDYAPAQASEGINQTITNPVVTCLNDSTTRTVKFSPVAGGQPVAGTVFINLDTGIIQFNSADAGKNFQVQYYAKYNQIEAEDFNRCWAAGPEYVVGPDSYCDYATIEEAIAAAPSGIFSTIKLRQNYTIATPITINKKIQIDGNGYVLTKSGSITNCFILTESSIIKNCVFAGWTGGSDITIYTATNKVYWVINNYFPSNTQAQNLSSVATAFCISGNIPTAVNITATPTTTMNITDGVVSGSFTNIEVPLGTLTDMGSGVAKISNISQLITKNYIANTAITAFQPVFIDLSDASKVGQTTTPQKSYYIGIALNSASISGSVQVAIGGIVSGFTGLVARSFYFVDSTGLITVNPTRALFCIGKAISSTEIALDIDSPIDHNICKILSNVTNSNNLVVEMTNGSVVNPLVGPLFKLGTDSTIGTGGDYQSSIVHIYQNFYLINKGTNFYYVKVNPDYSITQIYTASFTTDGTHTIDNIFKMIKIDGSRAMIFYMANGSANYKCAVIFVDTSITLISPNTIHTGSLDWYKIALCPYYDYTSIYVAKFRNDGSNLKSSVISFNKSTGNFSIGSETSYAWGVSGECSFHGAVAVDGKILVCVADGSSDVHGIFYSTTSITSITQTGTVQNLANDGNGSGGLSCALLTLNNTNIILSYGVGSGNFKIKSMTLSGTTLTVGTASSVGPFTLGTSTLLKKLTNQSFLFCLKDSTNTNISHFGNKRGTTVLESYGTLSYSFGLIDIAKSNEENECVAINFNSTANIVPVVGSVFGKLGTIKNSYQSSQRSIDKKGLIKPDYMSQTMRWLSNDDIIYMTPTGDLTADSSIAGIEIGYSISNKSIQLK